MPLHPMIVHFPIVFAVLSPLAILAVILWRPIAESKSAWMAVFVLHVFLTLSAFTAMQLGERDEERVEKAVAEQVIEYHEHWAERFAYATLAPLALCAALTLRRNGLLKGLALAASLSVLPLGVITGHSGGELVYTHNAARVFAVGPAAGPAGTANISEKGEHRGDD